MRVGPRPTPEAIVADSKELSLPIWMLGLEDPGDWLLGPRDASPIVAITGIADNDGW